MTPEEQVADLRNRANEEEAVPYNAEYRTSDIVIDEMRSADTIERLQREKSELEAQLADSQHWRERHCTESAANAAQSLENWRRVQELEQQVAALQTWDGLMATLDKFYPVSLVPTLPDDEKRDPGARIVSLVRQVAVLRAAIQPFAKYADDIDGHQDYPDCVPIGYLFSSPTVGDLRRARIAAAQKETP